MLLCCAIIAVGLGLVALAVHTGFRVEWILTDTVRFRRSQVSAWVPMAVFTLIGGVIAWYGCYIIWTTRTLASGRGNA